MTTTSECQSEPEPRPAITPPRGDDWWARARCNDAAGSLTGLFFSDDLIDIARAKAICSKCPVREPCLLGARERAEPSGVWGGELFVEGLVVAQKRRRGRPPKHPRPEIEVAEVPIPPHLQAPARTA